MLLCREYWYLAIIALYFTLGRLALLAAVGAGEYKNIQEACKATIRVVTELPANRSAKRYHDRAFPTYQQLYRSLKDDFKAIAALEK